MIKVTNCLILLCFLLTSKTLVKIKQYILTLNEKECFHPILTYFNSTTFGVILFSTSFPLSHSSFLEESNRQLLIRLVKSKEAIRKIALFFSLFSNISYAKSYIHLLFAFFRQYKTTNHLSCC